MSHAYQTMAEMHHDGINCTTVVCLRNDDMRQLSEVRDFIIKEVEDMKLLVGSHITVGGIDGRRMEFQVVVDDALRMVSGAYEWFAQEVLERVADLHGY